MRKHFLVGIIGKANGPTPIDVADFMVSFEPPIIAIKFCPFCGKNLIAGKDSMRVGTPL